MGEIVAYNWGNYRIIVICTIIAVYTTSIYLNFCTNIYISVDNTGAIVGGVFGGLALLAIIAFTGVLFVRKDFLKPKSGGREVFVSISGLICIFYEYTTELNVFLE